MRRVLIDAGWLPGQIDSIAHETTFARVLGLDPILRVLYGLSHVSQKRRDVRHPADAISYADP